MRRNRASTQRRLFTRTHRPSQIGDQIELLDQQVRRLCEGIGAPDSAVGGQLDRQPIEIRPRPNSGAVDGVVDPPDRREDRVDRNHTDRGHLPAVGG